jgi:hypothetical protein
MKSVFRTIIVVLLVGLVNLMPASAQNQTTPGAGNQNAVELSSQSPMVQSAYHFLIGQSKSIDDAKLREETLDAISNPSTCIRHREGLTDAARNQILQDLMNAGLVNPADNATFPGGLKAGVFAGRRQRLPTSAAEIFLRARQCIRWAPFLSGRAAGA